VKVAGTLVGTKLREGEFVHLFGVHVSIVERVARDSVSSGIVIHPGDGRATLIVKVAGMKS